METAPVRRAARQRVPSWLAPAAKTAFENVPEFGFNGSQTGIHELSPWDDNNVEPWREFISTKHFSNQPLRFVPDDRAAQLLGGGDP